MDPAYLTAAVLALVLSIAVLTSSILVRRHRRKMRGRRGLLDKLLFHAGLWSLVPLVLSSVALPILLIRELSPILLVLLTAAVYLASYAVGWSQRRSRSRRRLRLLRGECVACGYNLTGNTSGVCPECGTAMLRKPTIQSRHVAVQHDGRVTGRMGFFE